MSQGEARTDYWQQLGETLRSRTKSPLQSPSFVMFFILAVVICGGLGIWVEIVRAILKPDYEGNGILLAVNVFYPSLGCASAAQFIFNRSHPKYMAALASIMAALFIIGCIVLPFAWAHPCYVFPAEIILSLASLWAWWIANAENGEILDAPPPLPPATGPADPTAGALQGDVSSYSVD